MVPHGLTISTATAGISTHINSGQIYSALKAAVVQLTKVAASISAPRACINCICPGYIATPWFGRGLGLAGEDLSEAVDGRGKPL